ncbi:hypothetical protein BKK56_03790 [Rodentibacter genomosp. 2]|uniref:DEAD/DEAH box helicase n=1 Tax=Rodentibacter genomosp. 2 TaxID=1908266 RepID=UPI0009849660|nr:hypothetical protein BKK56_03790 [Rodentibacter genomosp. 2]
MKLKNYQTEALNNVIHYFAKSLTKGAAEAFKAIQPNLNYKIPSEHKALRDVPYVCVRIPTGGGKTLLASLSISLIAKQFLEQEYPVTLWLVPSKTIKSQTAEALKNPRHPYRKALDDAFNREVMVIESEDFTLLRPQDFGTKAIVVVSTIQNFRIENQDGRKIYAFNEKLTPHFERLPFLFNDELDKVTEADLQENGLQPKQLGKVKCSFANLLKAFRPLVIVDEAHNARTDLTFDVLANLQPSAILEFTATPNTDKKYGSNVLYHVSAGALKAEEMIKLPIVLHEHKTWQEAINSAVINRNELAHKAQFETDYVRPIVLFQAENKSGEVTVEKLKAYLMDSLNIDEAEIAIATGNQHELDNINLSDRTCPINYVITVEALKEGWDCPFAYVFCSVQNVASSKEAEQLLGRVLRMPYAKRRQIEDFNRAYAHLSSGKFGETVKEMEEKLIAMGFEALEIAEMLRTPLQDRIEFDETDFPIYQPMVTVFNVPKMLDITTLSETEKAQLKITQENDGFVVQVSGNVGENLEKILTKTVTGKAKEWLIHQIEIHNAKVVQRASPAEKGENFKAIPQLCVNIQGELSLVDPEELLGHYGWNLLDYPAKLERFNLENESRRFEIDVENNHLAYRMDYHQYQFSDEWLELSENDLVRWLARQVRVSDMTQEIILKFLQLIVHDLLAKPKVTLTQLVKRQFALAKDIEALINDYRQQALSHCYQQNLFDPNDEVEICLTPQHQYQFHLDNYTPNPPYYVGRFKFQKHYFAQIEDLKSTGEEFDCAMILDSLPQVKHWVRNPVKRGFSLPLAKDRFYPDFIAELNDGRILIVEYKGEPYKTNDDSKEKCLIAERWEKLSNGKCLFIMAVKKDDKGRDVRAQLLNKLI